MTIYALPPLPYPKNALAPHLSAESFDYHHGKHHAAYVSKLNELLAGHPWADMPLANLIVEAANRPDFPNARGIYNNAAQHWNHAQFWIGMKPNGGGAMPSELEKLVRVNFGTEAKFRQEFIAAAVGQFGSGWAWLVEKDERLEIRATSNADTPLTDSARPPDRLRCLGTCLLYRSPQRARQFCDRVLALTRELGGGGPASDRTSALAPMLEALVVPFSQPTRHTEVAALWHMRR